MRYLHWLVLMIGVVVSLGATANEIREFESPTLEQRYYALIEELRCPKCQNQNLEDSNAGIAVDLRGQVYEMIIAGQTDQQIIDYMVARYGEFVLYRPAHKQSTLLLWYGPFALLVIGAGIFVLIMMRNRRTAKELDG